MSYAIPAYYDEPVATAQAAPRDLIFIPRSRYQWIPMLCPLFFCGISWLGNGIPALTDLGFLAFSLLCGYFVLLEFIRFPRRFGIGGMILWGGVLCWFVQDYFTHWFNHDFNNSAVAMPAWVVAKAAFLHVLFVSLMSIGLNLKIGRGAEKILGCIPDPGDSRFYLWVMLAMFAFGVSPYFLFNAEPWYLCLYHAMFSGWVGTPKMTVFRTGNLNYNWGAYVAQIMQVGAVSGIVSIVYTILVAKNWASRLLGFTIWWFYAMLAFETGRRGEMCFSVLPPIALLFIKYQAKAAMLFKKFSLRAYVVCGLLTFGLFFIVHFEGTFRELSYNDVDMSQLDLTANQGNTMFSEGLLAYSLVGSSDVPFFYANHFTGEGAIVAIPYTVFDFVVGMIPRALWNDKPVDKLWSWYNQAYTGIGNGLTGTTISHGLIGSWYFKYGLVGMMEGALLVGWLMGVAERTLQNSEGRPITILMSLGFSVWLFRTYRDFIFIDLYGLVMGGIALSILIPLLRPLLASKPE